MLLQKKKFLVAFAVGMLGASTVLAANPAPIPPQEFAQLHQRIKPQQDESLFWQIPWLLSLDEALQRGAAEGKPILVWSGAGGAPHTVC